MKRLTLVTISEAARIFDVDRAGIRALIKKLRIKTYPFPSNAKATGIDEQGMKALGRAMGCSRMPGIAPRRKATATA